MSSFGAGSMQSQDTERLKVRLDAGPASRVRAADGKHDLWHYEIFFSAAAAGFLSSSCFGFSGSVSSGAFFVFM